ncbi:MAG: hypothetical protein ACOZQL_12220 [Myxococcota bacterium]
MRIALVVAVLVAGAAFAQEIGTEITPVTPSSGVNPQPTSSTPATSSQPEQKSSGYTYKPKGAKEEAKPTWEGTRLSASSGDFGVRAGFGASGSISLPTTARGSSVAAPSVGISYLATDGFKLLVDLGAGFAMVGSNVLLALNATVGFDYLFRTPADALRPFFHFAGFFNMAGSSSFDIGFGAQLGFGAEYFFNPAFSVNGRLLLAVPMAVSGEFTLGIFTVTPGVGATWYF